MMPLSAHFYLEISMNRKQPTEIHILVGLIAQHCGAVDPSTAITAETIFQAAYAAAPDDPAWLSGRGWREPRLRKRLLKHFRASIAPPLSSAVH